MTTLDKSARMLRRMARGLAMLAVIASVWFFGSDEGWIYLTICQLISASMVLWLFSLMASSRPRIRVPCLTFVLLLLVGYTGLQVIPLPRRSVEILNPFSAGIQHESMETFRRVDSNATLAPPGDHRSGAGNPASAGDKLPAFLKDEPGFMTLSVCPGATLRNLYLLIAYACTFLVMANCIRSWRQLKFAVVLFVVSGFFLSLLGIIHKFSGSAALLWFREVRYGGELFGPFTNPNHFAAHINMLLGAALGLYLSSSRIREALSWPDWSDRIAWLSSRRASSAALSAFAVGLMGGAMCFSLSRGGITSFIAAAGLTFFLTTFLQGMKRKANVRIIAGLVIIIAIVVWLGWRPVVEELLTLELIARNPVDDARFIATGNTLQIFGSCPLFGSGFGSFRHVFPFFEDTALHFGRWLHAHNDWAQFLAEGGFAGTGILVLFLFLWVKYIVKHFSMARAKSELMILGLTVGFIAIAIHSFWDYSLQKPGNMFLLAALAGIAIAAVHVDRKENNQDEPDSNLETGCMIKNNFKPVFVRVAALSVITAMVLLSYLESLDLRGEMAFARFLYMRKLVEKINVSADSVKVIADVRRQADQAMLLCRNNPDAIREITTFTFGWVIDRHLDGKFRAELAQSNHRYAALAVQSAPSDFLAWLWLGRANACVGRWDEAEMCLERARELVAPGFSLKLF